MDDKFLADRKITAEIAAKYDCSTSACNNWAQKNGVQMIGRVYFWSDEDIARFGARAKPGGQPGPRGRRWKKRPANSQ